MKLWEESLITLKNSEMKARVIGVQISMEKFSFHFNCLLVEHVLRSPDVSEVEGREMAANEIAELESKMLDGKFEFME